MNIKEKKNKLIKARNLMSEVFNDSKEDWTDNWWCQNLMEVMGSLDVVISKISNYKPKGIKAK